ncbi:hypothetical protein B0H11DRAFT_2240397 [Mycena galericulata]|nr:hypothetical protein B0H11DRAFT_2240397 [Mycena galericulata]
MATGLSSTIDLFLYNRFATLTRVGPRFFMGPNHAELREILTASSLDIRELVSLELSAGFGSPDDVALSIWEVSVLSPWVPSSLSLTELASPVVAEGVRSAPCELPPPLGTRRLIDRVGPPLVLLTAFLRVSSNLSLPGPNHAEIRELLATATVNIHALVSLELVDLIKFGSTELDHLSSPDNVALSIRWSPFCLVRVISPAVQWPVGLLWRYGSFVRAPTSSGTSSPNIRGPVSRLYQAPIDPAGPPLVLLTAFCVHDDQSAGFGSPDDVALLIWERSGLCLVGGMSFSLSLTAYAYFDVVGVCAFFLRAHTSFGNSPSPHRPRPAFCVHDE